MWSIQASKTSADFYKKSCPKCSSIQMENGTKLWVYIPMSELVYLLCGCGSSWFVFTCSSLLVTRAWCFFAVLHMLSFNCKFLWWFFVVLHMGCSSCGSSHALLLYLYLGVDLLCLLTWASLLVHGCGCFVVLQMIFYFTCTWVWLFCGSSHDLLLYLYMGLVVLWFFRWSSTLLVHGCGCFVVVQMIVYFTCTWVWLFCGSSHDLLLYMYMGVLWTINSGILLRSNLTLISFLPSLEQQKKIVLLLKWFLLLFLHTQLATSTPNNNKIPKAFCKLYRFASHLVTFFGDEVQVTMRNRHEAIFRIWKPITLGFLYLSWEKV
jgi:hypothetical protein